MTGDIATRPIDLLRFVSLENEQFLVLRVQWVGQGRGGAHMSGHPLSIVRVTWLAKYRKVLAETGNEGEAIFEADRSVRRAHGSSARTDDGAMLARNAPTLGCYPPPWPFLF